MNQGFVKIFISLLAFTSFLKEAPAQGWCGTKLTDVQNQFILDYNFAQNRRIILSKINRTLNVTAWIVQDKEGLPSHDSVDVVDAVADISDSFAPIELSFMVCKVNYIENWQFNAWDNQVHSTPAGVLYYQPNTINIYFVGDIATPAGAAGFVTGVGSSGDQAIVIKELTALTHEMGHYFGLPHTFNNPGSELVDGSNCLTAGDMICDTEADADPTGENVDALCNYVGPPLRDPNNDFYEPPTDNIMSYYPCPCQRFTTGQFQLMAFTYFNSLFDLW